MREFSIIEGAMSFVLEALGKEQGAKSEFKIEGFSSRLESIS